MLEFILGMVGISVFAGIVVGVLKWNLRAGATTAVITPFIIAAGFAAWVILFPLEFGPALWARALTIWNYLGPFAWTVSAVVGALCLLELLFSLSNKRYGRFAVVLGGLIALGAFALYESQTALKGSVFNQFGPPKSGAPPSGFVLEKSHPEHVVGLSGDTRKDFVETGARECQAKQKAKNAGMPDALLTEYCSCVVSKLADVLSPDELRFMFGPVPAEVQKKVITTDSACKAALASSHSTPAPSIPTAQQR